jgi:hypothetical protein
MNGNARKRLIKAVEIDQYEICDAGAIRPLRLADLPI